MIPTLQLLLALGLLSVITGVSNAFAMFMNGLNFLGLQVIGGSIMALTNIGLKIVFAGRIGVPGVAYATVVAQVLCVLIPCLFYVPHVLRTVDRRAIGIGERPAER